MSQSPLPPLDKVDPVEAWKPWEPDGKNPWNLKWAGHLCRRAGFGAPLRPNAQKRLSLEEAVQSGLPSTLERLFRGDPDFEERDKFLSALGRTVLPKNDPFDLKGWWLYGLVYTKHPLREKMVLFWHNHFATSIVKVQSADAMYQQNELLRKHALGKFRPMLLDMSRDPAMLIWLDSNSNVKGKPNENYAREVMELFSLGVGNYTEKDIREAARAFTGWHTNGTAFTFNASEHDDDPKTVLKQTGNWDGGDIIRILLEQPVAARFLVRKLYRYFINESVTPPDRLIEPLAASLRKSDYDIGAVVRTMLSSRHFFSDYAYRQRIKSPVEYCLLAVQSVGQGFASPRALIGRMEAMGQQLFAPPNVKGWDGGKSWLNSATVLARHNFAQALTMGMGELNLEDRDPSRGIAVAIDAAAIVRNEKLTDPEKIVDFLLNILLQGDVARATRERLIDFVNEGKPQDSTRDQRVRETIYAIMTMPEYQLA